MNHLWSQEYDQLRSHSQQNVTKLYYVAHQLQLKL